MFTTQHIEPITLRSRIRPGTVVTTLGVLIAIAVTVVFLALTGSHRTTVATRATTSQAAATATPHTHYLGPRQQQAPTTTHDASAPSAHSTCLGAAQRCLR